MFSSLESQTRQLLAGNILLICCCIFYLIWWFIAFKPEGAVKGMKSGWLLIPAFILGIFGIIQIVRGSSLTELPRRLMPTAAILLVGLAVYIVLLIVTRTVMNRPVTTELLLIVGWAVLAFLEINALYGMERFARAGAVVFLLIIAAAAVIGLICYLLYYGLDVRAGYIDGTIPLLLVAVVMTVLSVRIVI